MAASVWMASSMANPSGSSDLTVDRAYDPARDRRVETERAPDRDDCFAHGERVRIAELEWVEYVLGRVDLEHCEVG